MVGYCGIAGFCSRAVFLIISVKVNDVDKIDENTKMKDGRVSAVVPSAQRGGLNLAS